MSRRDRMRRFASFWIFPPLALALLGAGRRAEPNRGGLELIGLLLAGLFAWTLLEYLLHRFLFHVRIPIRNPRLRRLLNSSHLEHHAAPRDSSKVLVHPLYALAISGLLYALLYMATGSVFSTAGALAGIWAGFLCYEGMHYGVHFSLASSWIGSRRRAHFYHHFIDNKQCFGVTSPLWDYVFGTWARKTGVTN